MTSLALSGFRREKREFNPRVAIVLLALSMFCTGASGLVNEYVLATVSSQILGNSIEQFSITVALMMLMMGVGGWAQKCFTDRWLFTGFFGVEVTLAILGGFAPIAIYALYNLLTDNFNLVYYAYVMTIGFLIGFEIPLVMRLNDSFGMKLRVNISYVYAADYAGSFVGAIVWVYILLKYFLITEISFLVAGLNFAVAIVTLAYFLSHGRIRSTLAKAGVVGTIMLTATALGYGYVKNRGWNATLEQSLYNDPIVVSMTTRYQHIVVTHAKSSNDYCFFLNGGTQMCSSDEAIYHEQLVHPVMSLVPDHENVLILGGGDGLALREVLKYQDVRSVTLVDLDPELVKLTSTNPVFTNLNKGSFQDARVDVRVPTGIKDGEGYETIYRETGRYDSRGRSVTKRVADVKVIHIDADLFIRDIPKKYGVVIIDFPDPRSIELAKLYSKEFFMKLRKRVSEYGAVVIQSTSPYHSKEAYLIIARTMRAAGFKTLPYHDNVPSFGEWGWHLGWKSKMTQADVMRKLQSVKSFPVKTRYLTPDLMRASFVFGKGWLTAKDHSVSTLMHPIVLQLYLEDGWKIE